MFLQNVLANENEIPSETPELPPEPQQPEPQPEPQPDPQPDPEPTPVAVAMPVPMADPTPIEAPPTTDPSPQPEEGKLLRPVIPPYRFRGRVYINKQPPVYIHTAGTKYYVKSNPVIIKPYMIDVPPKIRINPVVVNKNYPQPVYVKPTKEYLGRCHHKTFYQPYERVWNNWNQPRVYRRHQKYQHHEPCSHSHQHAYILPLNGHTHQLPLGPGRIEEIHNPTSEDIQGVPVATLPSAPAA